MAHSYISLNAISTLSRGMLGRYYNNYFRCVKGQLLPIIWQDSTHFLQIQG